MKVTLDEDYPDRFSYELKATLEYPDPFDSESVPQHGNILISQRDVIGEFQWEQSLCWSAFWSAISDRLLDTVDRAGQSGFDGWSDKGPTIGYSENMGNIEVEVSVFIPVIFKFEDERDLGEICLTLKFNKKTGELIDWQV